MSSSTSSWNRPILVLISRADRLSDEQQRHAAEQLEKRSHFPGVMSLPIRHGQVDPQLLLGLSRDEELASESACPMTMTMSTTTTITTIQNCFQRACN